MSGRQTMFRVGFATSQWLKLAVCSRSPPSGFGKRAETVSSESIPAQLPQSAAPCAIAQSLCSFRVLRRVAQDHRLGRVGHGAPVVSRP